MGLDDNSRTNLKPKGEESTDERDLVGQFSTARPTATTATIYRKKIANY